MTKPSKMKTTLPLLAALALAACSKEAPERTQCDGVTIPIAQYQGRPSPPVHAVELCAGQVRITTDPGLAVAIEVLPWISEQHPRRLKSGLVEAPDGVASPDGVVVFDPAPLHAWGDSLLLRIDDYHVILLP